MKKVHSLKYISSNTGLGLPGNGIERNYVSPDTLITTETWGQMDNFWSESGVIIAKPGYKWVTKWSKGSNFISTKILDSDGKVVAYYFDVCSPVEVKDGEFSFYDWYIDVWYPVVGKPVVLDEGECRQALHEGYINEGQYRAALHTGNFIVRNIDTVCNF